MASNDTEKRFLDLIQDHQKILYKLAYVYTRRVEDRRDLVQEMLIQLWRSFESFDARVQFSTWMYRVALNVAISFYRSEHHAARKTISLEDYGIDLPAIDGVFDGDSDNLRALKAAVDDLDEIHRVLILMFLDGSSYDEIGAVLGISASNVGTRLNRLKQRLKDTLS